MRSIRPNERRLKCLAVATAAGLTAMSQAKGQTLGAGQISISTSGSTALKNWFVAAAGGNTFTDVQPFVSGISSGLLSINGNTYPTAGDGGANYWAGNGGTGGSYQLAPKTNTTVQGTSTDSSNAIQFTYHESGSVEGILELANDQISTQPYVTANIDRNPEGGNAVWINYNQTGLSGVGTGAATFNATSGTSAIGTSGLHLGNFYATGVGQTGTPGVTTTWVPGSASNPTPSFTNVGGVGMNANGGQNAVQIALSDAYPQQVFKNDYANTSNTYVPQGGTSTVTVSGSNNNSFNANPLDQGYGAGNTVLPSGLQLGTPGFRPNYQSPSTLNMPAAAINPRTGAAFGVGAWNSATNGGLGNLNAQLVAVTATAFVANPGTGLSQVDRTDADWLETTGHLTNGAVFNMTTRDVNSGTRDVSSLDTGVDPSYSTGKNDNGNGTLVSAVSNSEFDQESIGPAQRFSNKTAGGAQLRPTVQNNRMSVGTLSINDAGSNDRPTDPNALRVLSYSDSTDGSSPYVSPNYKTISNGTYVIYQNEVAVTVRKPDANYATNTVTTAANGAQLVSGSIQGDDASGDAVALLNQATNSVASAFSTATPADVADGLLSQGYLVPNLMQVQKNFNGQGLDNSVAGQIATGHIVSAANPNYSSSLFATYSGTTAYTGKLPDLTTLGTVTTGQAGSTYGGKGGTFEKANYNGGAITLSATNYLFGNFNQDGSAQGGNDLTARDFSAVKSALAADKALITADKLLGASVPGSEFSTVADNNANWNGGTVAIGTNGALNTASITYTDSLGIPHTLAKGDLIVMGDFLGTGHFDGASLVALADGSAISDSTGTDRLSAKTIMTGVLDKNAAMDYMNSNVGNVTPVDQYIRKTGAAVLEGASVPAGATAVTNLVSGTAQLDPVSGLAEFTYDPTGVNTFNKSDVQQAGVVDFNSAVTVDNVIGKNPSNIGDQLSATQLAPITGQVSPLNLYMAQQVDGGGAISQADLNVVNTALTGSGTTNWYGYNLQKNGTGTLTWGRTGGSVNVSNGASFQVSNGVVNVGGTIDPFSDNNAAVGNHVALAVDHGAAVHITQHQTTLTVAGLTIDTASNSVLDVGDNALIIKGSGDPIASGIQGYLTSGFNGGAWNGPGIDTSAPTTFSGSSYGLGYAGSSDPGNPAGLASGTIEVKYTLLGDVDLNGIVNGVDFGILAANFNKAVSGWDQGDFNYDGVVNGIDFAELAANFNKGVDGAAGVGGALSDASLVAFAQANGLMADVPEPASATLLVLAGAGILARRRRR